MMIPGSFSKKKYNVIFLRIKLSQKLRQDAGDLENLFIFTCSIAHREFGGFF